MKVKVFDRAAVGYVRDEVIRALKPLEEELGVKIVQHSGSFNVFSYTMKIEIATVGDAGEVQSKERENFKFMAPKYGLSPDDLDREFFAGNARFRITGIVPRRYAMPISAERIYDGKKFKFSPGQVKRGFTNG